MNNTLIKPQTVTFDQAVVATYGTHSDAETAVRQLAGAGLPMESISIIGRNFETHEDIQGFYHPGDAARDGAVQGAWFGGIFGLMMGAFGFFVLPGIGALMVLGPLSGLLAGAVGGAGIGALVNALVVAGVPKDMALTYQTRLQAGEFLVVVHGGPEEATRAHEVLDSTGPIHLQSHDGNLIEADATVTK